MRFRSLSRGLCLGLLLCAGLMIAPLHAQPSNLTADGVRSTILEVELLSGADSGALHAQAWGQLFDRWNISLVIRRGLVDDKPETSEKINGTLRTVRLIGRLERDGQLQFQERRFSRGQSTELKEWLDELKTYGVQGAPSGKPLWGLTKPQFEALYASLSVPLKGEVFGDTLPVAIEKLALPSEYPLRWSTAAEKAFVALGPQNLVRQRLTGFTTATALAVLLNDRGFGFRPNRTPAGAIELLVDRRADDPLEQWPVGWPAQKQVPQLLPGMFVMMNISLQDDPALPILEVASEVTKTPILIDYASMARSGVDMQQLRVSHPLKKTTWSLALRAILVPNKLNREYWQDEAGRGFVWITTIGKPRPGATQP